MITLYGIKNCDTVKKARKWLEEIGVDHKFHDFRKDGFDEALVSKLESALGWEALLNTRGTTWRKLDDTAKADMNTGKAIALMAAHDAIIKRPVWEKSGDYKLGFAPKDQEAIKAWAQA
ncbi:MAG: ArsC family reductase [Kordiimonadaceae bacterium]|nr:ArsC family reductase [Kordiimonadaceae bacterium]